MKTFEQEYIDLCVKHAKRKHISKARAFNLTKSWSYRCINRINGKILDMHIGKRLSSNTEGQPRREDERT
jgi:hypothetical protein